MTIKQSSLNLYLIIFIILLSGLGSTFLGIPLFTNVSTLVLYFTIIYIALSDKFIFPHSFKYIIAFILIQTFIINYQNIIFLKSFIHFFGILCFSIVAFTTVNKYNSSLHKIIRVYYSFCIFLSLFGLIQLFLFLFFGYSLLPQIWLSGNTLNGGRVNYVPEIFDLIPRIVGLSTEPAHYAIILLPGVYVSILNVLGKGFLLGINSKISSYIVLAGFIFSFSIVGYFGLVLCLISIFFTDFKSKYYSKLAIISISSGAIYLVTKTNLISKLVSLPQMLSDITRFNYTTSDLTGFALVSNMLVALKSFVSSFGLGSGLNSHAVTYDKVIYQLFSSSQVIMELNKEDGGSLFIRIFSEFGIIGIFGFFLFLFKFRIKSKMIDNPLFIANRLSLVVLIGYSVRNGGYLNILLWLFIAIYYYSYRQYSKLSDIDTYSN